MAMEKVHAHIFSIDNEILCILDYYSKVPVIKGADKVSADDLIKATKLCSQNLVHQIVSDVGMNFVSD